MNIPGLSRRAGEGDIQGFEARNVFVEVLSRPARIESMNGSLALDLDLTVGSRGKPVVAAVIVRGGIREF